MPIPQPLTCSAEEQQLLLHLAHQAIEEAIVARPAPLPPPETLSETLQTPAATFVTLHHQERLRGCVGSLTPRDALFKSVASNAVAAALRDTRFPPVTSEIARQLLVHVSILSELVPLPPGPLETRLKRITPGEDGIVLKHAGRTATFLPQVWETFRDTEMFLKALSKKAGLEEGTWRRAEVELSLYRVTAFGEAIQHEQSRPEPGSDQQQEEDNSQRHHE